MTERPAQRTPNRQLAALIAEAGFSNAGLARRVDQLGLEHGLDLRYDKTSVTRWLRGQQPRGTTPALIAEVFTRRLGRRLTAQDLGLDACAPVYAGLEFAATPEEAVDIVSGLWRKDSGSHAELRKIAFTPAGLVVPSRDWLIGRPDDRVGRGDQPAAVRVPVQGGPACPGSAGRPNAGPGRRSPAVTSPRSARSASCSAPSTTPTGAATPGRPSSATWNTRPSPCCAARTASRRAAGCSRRPPTSPGSRAGRRTTSRRTASPSATSSRRCGSRRRRRTGRTARYVLVTMSRQAVYLGHGREAVQLARVAQQGVGTTAPPVVQSLLHAVRGARPRGAGRGPGLHRLPRTGRTRPGSGPARRRGPALGAVLRRGAARRRVRALPPRSPAVPRRRPARGALAPAARPRLRPQPAVLPCRARLGPAGPRRAGPGLPAGRRGGRRRRRRCARCGRSSTYGTSSGAWSPTGTRHRSGGTATRSLRSARRGAAWVRWFAAARLWLVAQFPAPLWARRSRTSMLRPLRPLLS